MIYFLNKDKTKENKHCLGYTLIELMVVISIIGILAVLGLPNFIKYQNNLEIRTAAKDMRSFFWDAQSRSEAPSKSDVVWYHGSLVVQSPPLTAPTTWSLLSWNGTADSTISLVGIPQNVYIKKIELDGVSAALGAGVDMYFVPAPNRSLGTFYAKNTVTNQLSSSSIVITLGSIRNTSEYKITLDQAKYQVSITKSV